MDKTNLSDRFAAVSDLVERANEVVSPRPLPEVFEDYLRLLDVKVEIDREFAERTSDPDTGYLRADLAADYSDGWTVAIARRRRAETAVRVALTPGRVERFVTRHVQRVVEVNPRTWERLFRRSESIRVADEALSHARDDVKHHENLIEGQREAAQVLRSVGIDTGDELQATLGDLRRARTRLLNPMKQLMDEGYKAIERGAPLPAQVTQAVGRVDASNGRPEVSYAPAAFDMALRIYADSDRCADDHDTGNQSSPGPGSNTHKSELDRSAQWVRWWSPPPVLLEA